ncbi:hypothetical protein HK100_002006 [Physocladia obscura]|uniref:Uncharacterized protein n=1 Tax=Physocladia obscura TaxID=109957 RepID=A0AAD5SVZ8_9FUNG|nr:hypothetical protein HK100_002006 [Physocladia obscura]
MNSQQKTCIDDMHPGVGRDQSNNTHNNEALGSVSPMLQKKGPIAEDVYPAGIKAIENRGTAEQVAELHRMEAGFKALK